jgi:hypothetical protein
MAIASLGLYLMSGLDASSSAWDVIWRLCIVGLGMGMFQSPNNSAVMGSVPPWHLGIASGILAAVRNVGMVLGIAITSAVLHNSLEFLDGMYWAYITSAGIAALAALTSLAASNRGMPPPTIGPPPGASETGQSREAGL